MSKTGGKLKPPVSPAILFGGEIEAAIASGAPPEGLTLRLTLGDGHKLRRDASVPLESISYVGGAMHFLGVLVVEGGVTASVLERGA